MSSCIFFIISVFYVNLVLFFLIITSAYFPETLKGHKALNQLNLLSSKNLQPGARLLHIILKQSAGILEFRN